MLQVQLAVFHHCYCVCHYQHVIPTLLALIESNKKSMAAIKRLHLQTVIVGDSDVLKAHFLKQTAGLYEPANTDLQFYMQDPHLVDLSLYDKAVYLAIWNICKFVIQFNTNIKPHPTPPPPPWSPCARQCARYESMHR